MTSVRMIYVLKQFNDKAIKHTIMLTTNKETLGSSLASVIKNNAMQPQLIKELWRRTSPV